MQSNYSFNNIKVPENNSEKTSQVVAITPDYTFEHISNQHIFLINTTTKKTLILEQYLIPVLHELKTFQTLKTHIKNIDKKMNLGGKANNDIIKLINTLDEAEFILHSKEADEFFKKSKSNPITEQPVVVVRTANRVSMLKRFIQSAEKNEQTYNARYQYLLIDDSKPELAEANGINIKNSHLKIIHIDQPKQSNILNSLKKALPKYLEEIDFLLGQSDLHRFDIAYGRTWNWGVLLTAGKPVVFLDDDCLLNAYQPPIEMQAHPSFHNTNKDIRFIDKSTPMNEQLSSIPLDPIASLASTLGIGIENIQANKESLLGLESSLLSKTNPQAIISTQGIAGDPGSSSCAWLYHLESESTKAFIADDEKTYQSNKLSRFAWTGYQRPKISFGYSNSMVARALDNRQLLPPTFPIFRNEDALFTNLVSFLYPQHFSIAQLCS